jgi:hypothetical protein
MTYGARNKVDTYNGQSVTFDDDGNMTNGPVKGSMGSLTYDAAIELFNHTNKLLGHDVDVSFCQHQSAPPICYCRKPQVGMGVEFINRYKLNRKDCIMVGDFTSDKTFAERCGFQYVDQEEFFK